MIEILYDFIDQNIQEHTKTSRNYGDMAYMMSCRIYIINRKIPKLGDGSI